MIETSNYFFCSFYVDDARIFERFRLYFHIASKTKLMRKRP
jgi:hypothetical protein